MLGCCQAHLGVGQVTQINHAHSKYLQEKSQHNEGLYERVILREMCLYSFFCFIPAWFQSPQNRIRGLCMLIFVILSQNITALDYTFIFKWNPLVIQRKIFSFRSHKWLSCLLAICFLRECFVGRLFFSHFNLNQIVWGISNNWI